ncbi:Endogenous retrovirus group K member 5 Gag polyprotein [Manis javanica]|nr:Endogenous retrovirus group K member 5 Gag polyprotein [Manis javanica]
MRRLRPSCTFRHPTPRLELDSRKWRPTWGSKECCPWFPKDTSVDMEIWDEVSEGLRYTREYRTDSSDKFPPPPPPPHNFLRRSESPCPRKNLQELLVQRLQSLALQDS